MNLLLDLSLNIKWAYVNPTFRLVIVIQLYGSSRLCVMQLCNP